MRHLKILPLLLLLAGAADAQLDTFMVYPGDTNNDSLVSVRDLLPIGIAWFQETPPRPEPPSTDWAPQFSEGLDFLTLPTTGINFAHIDADGNSFIDTLDSDIIALNYDSVVIEGLSDQYHPNVAATPVPNYCPYIRLAFDRDTAMVSDTFYLDIFIEGFPADGVPEPEGVLGTSFTLEFDAVNIKDSLLAAYPDTLPQDLMFVYATFQEAVATREAPIRHFDFAAAGYGQNAIQSNRKLATLSFITEDLIMRGENVAVPFFFDQNTLIKTTLTINREEAFFLPDCPPQMDTIILFDPFTNSVEKADVGSKHWVIFPNPTRGDFFLKGDLTVERLRLLTANGRLLWEKKGELKGERISSGKLSPGVYLLELVSGDTTHLIRLIKL